MGDSITNGPLPQPALFPVLDELAWSLQGDPIAQKLLPQELEILLTILNNKNTDVNKIVQSTNFVYNIIVNNYKNTAEDLLQELITTKNKTLLKKVTKIYCSVLMNRGYDPRYIRHCVDDIFFSKDHKRIQKALLKRFFACFSDDTQKYQILCKIDKSFSLIVSKIYGVKSHTNKNTLPAKFNKAPMTFLKHGRDQAFLHFDFIEAKDPFSARVAAEEYLNAARSIVFTVPTTIAYKWHEGMYVCKEGARSGRILNKRISPLQRHVPVPRTEAINEIEQFAQRIFGSKIGTTAMARIVRALHTRSLARVTQNLENQLVSLWSSIEVLLSDPAENVARINHYCELVIPCICREYGERVFKAAFRDIARGYKDQFLDIVENCMVGNSAFEKFVAILSNNNNAELQQDLLRLINDSPLALYRCFQLNKEFSTYKGLFKVLSDHEQRIDWQVRRIYRARNNVVHSGMKPAYIGTLIANADDYFLSTVSSIIGRIGNSSSQRDLDQIIWDINIGYKLKRELIRRISQSVQIGCSPDSRRSLVGLV